MDDSYRSRAAAELVAKALDTTPVVAVLGARQTGKSTLAREEPFLHNYLYLSLDDLDVRERAAGDPDGLLAAAPRLIIDEIQRDPALWLAIKRAVDADRPRRRGRFVVTGSANLLLMHRVSESLAGRASYVTLWPLTRRERLALGRAGLWSAFFAHERKQWYDIVREEAVPRADWRTEVRIGGYPTPSVELGTAEQRALWFDGYVRTFLERDLQDLSAVDSLVDFRRLMKAAALRVGTIVNQAEVARGLGLPRATVHRYLNLLETAFQIVRVESYSVSRTRRLVKSPKLFWSDVALAMHLGGEETPRGAHLENLVLSDLLVWRDAQVARAEILYWRTTTDLEVDFVIEHNDVLLPVEVKAARRASTADVRGLQAFRRDYADRCPGGLLLYDGEDVQWLGDGILAAPWHRVV